MRVLLVHQNFPGQFRHLAPALQAAGDDVVAIGSRPALSSPSSLSYLSSGGAVGDALRHGGPEARLQQQLAQGRRVAGCLRQLAAEGWRPDVVLAHPFWGDVLFLDDVFPAVPLVALMELDLAGIARPDGRPHGAGPALLQWTTLQAVHRMAFGLSATAFQRDSFPAWLRPRIAVLHEGIDLERCRPEPVLQLRLPDGTLLRAGEPTLSFCSRSLEPLRGFDTLLRALPRLLAHHPGARVVICGEDRCAYGPPPAQGGSWRQALLAELGPRLDPSRLHFTGLLPHATLRDLFRISAAHVYLTQPYVLSWSLLEAMACGALVVASRTAPVQEVLEHGREGLLVPFPDPDALATTLLEVLQRPAAFGALRLAARRRLLRDFDRRVWVARQRDLLLAAARGEDPLATGRHPPGPPAGGRHA